MDCGCVYRGYCKSGLISQTVLLCVCLTLFSGCFLKKNAVDSGSVKLAKFGVTMKLPENFQPLPKEGFKDIGTLRATVLEVNPFTVIPQYAYIDSSGKAVMVVSELQFSEENRPEKYPMDNIYIYQKNLETHFASGKITSEELNGQDVTTVLMAMMFQEDGKDIALFKGLCYVYPNCFFMIDLYVQKDEVTSVDASSYVNAFNSLGVY
jgi:hypothetical protein